MAEHSDTITTLNTLIATTIDSITGYEESAQNIDNERLREIFREFYKVPSHSGTEDGFGLGLYIVARLTHILGHPHSLSSQPGRG
mgnify:CR=1 FL=1